MKSIVQEASSVAKAIDQAWHAAGYPETFSVKVLEHPKRNFLGFATESAKIALSFNGDHPRQSDVEAHAPKRERKKRSSSGQKQKKTNTKQQTGESQSSQSHTENGQKTSRSRQNASQQTESAPQEHHKQTSSKRKKRGSSWDQETVDTARKWLENVLAHMDQSDITFTIEPQQHYLRITLSKPILSQEQEEKHLLASLAHLLLTTLKRQCKKPLYGHKVVLTHEHN